ncbi:MAG: SH3 domain-containing protein, partial [Clostridia bacterium]|nr:SH3 domain-containing protein [Clostridia bacterium]
DKVFLLSDSEARKYFIQDSDDSFDNKDRIGDQTAYLSNKKKENPIHYWTYYRDDDVTDWWLRTRGVGNDNTFVVDTDGRIVSGYNMIQLNTGVRPAIWLKTAMDTSDTVTVSDIPGNEDEAAIKKLYFVNTKQDALRVRSEPDENSNILNSLPKGTKVLVVDNKNGWSQIEYESIWGWVKSEYLKQASANEIKNTDRIALFYSIHGTPDVTGDTPPKHVTEMIDSFTGKNNYIYAGEDYKDYSCHLYYFLPTDYGTVSGLSLYMVSGEAVTVIPSGAAGGIYPDWAHGKTIEEWYPLVVKAIAEQYPSYGSKSYWITLGGDGYNDDVIYAMPDDESCTFEVSYDLKSVKKGQVRYFEG